MTLAETFPGNHLKKFIEREGLYMLVASSSEGIKEGESVAEDLEVLEGPGEVDNEESSLEAGSEEQDQESLP